MPPRPQWATDADADGLDGAVEAEARAFAFPPVPADQADESGEDETGEDEQDARRGWRRAFLPLLLIVLPTLLVAAFEYGIAADQYMQGLGGRPQGRRRRRHRPIGRRRMEKPAEQSGVPGAGTQHGDDVDPTETRHAYSH